MSAPSTPTPPIPAAPSRGSPPPLSWRSWPVADEPWQQASLAVVVGGTVAMIVYTSGSVAWAALAALAECVAAWRFFVPVIYEVNALGFSEHRFGKMRRIAWSAIQMAETGRQGVLLLVDVGRGWRARGEYIPCHGHLAAVQGQLEYYLPASRRRISGEPSRSP